MTDNEIKKALECCIKSISNRNCGDCPLLNQECIRGLPKYALDLINRQQAEIERLQTELDLAKAFYKEKEAEFSLLNYKYNKTLNQLNDYQSIARTEAIKSFAEELKEDLKSNDYIVSFERIDNLVKEMVGEE